MSVFGVTNYLLVTQKGRTYIPFIRGTGFLADFENVSFYSKHVITAAHVACPLRFPSLFGRPPLFSRIGERHLTPKVIMFHPSGKRQAMLPLELNVSYLKGTSVSSLRIRGERDLFPQMIHDGLQPPKPFELDDGEIGENEPLILKGLELDRDEEGADVAEMTPLEMNATAKLKYDSKMFGPTVICETSSILSSEKANNNDNEKKKPRRNSVSAGMSGCPVIRKSNGKCVGMLIAGVKTKPTPKKFGAASASFSQRNDVDDEQQEGFASYSSSSLNQKKKKGSIFNEERLPQRVNDDTAMNLALQEFEMAHRNLEAPCLDLMEQDETLKELFGSEEAYRIHLNSSKNSEDDEKQESQSSSSSSSTDEIKIEEEEEERNFAAFVSVKEFMQQLRASENV